MSLLIYTSVTGFAFVMCLWALLTSVFGDPEHSRGHRFVTGLVAVSVLVVAPAAALAAPLGVPRLVWATGLLPILFLLATWSNIVSLRADGLVATIVGLPIAAFNLLHVGLYAVWFLQECLGMDLGTWGCALTAGDAQLQMLSGAADARDNPIWLRLPVLLPLWSRLSFLRFLSLLVASSYSAVLLLAFAMMMPHSYRRSQSYHEATTPPVAPTRYLGVKVPWGQRGLASADYERVRLHTRLLGAHSVTFEISSDTLADAAQLQRLQAEIAWAKAVGIETIAIAQPSRRFQSIPAASLQTLHADLMPTQRSAAADLQPDVLVLSAGPLGRLSAMIADSTSLSDWFSAIERSARMVRETRPAIRLAVTLVHCDARTEQLFRRLRSATSPIDIVGLSIFPDSRLMRDLELDLQQVARWCNDPTGVKPVWILEAGSSPPSFGGDLGHWNFLARVLALADKTPTIKGVCIDSLYDLDRNLGLINWAGRRRLSYRKLLESADYRRAGSPPAPDK